MDERHWWIAGKIQESFHVGGEANPALLEEFMTDESNSAKLDEFFKAGGPCRLFIFCEKPEYGNVSVSQLHVTGTLASLKDVSLENLSILYFLRNRIEKDVDPSRMERDVFCGVLKHNAIDSLTNLLSEIYIPLIKAQKDWGLSQGDDGSHNTLTNSLDRFMTALVESSTSVHTSKQLVLKQPENVIVNDFKQQRAAVLDPQLIGEYEDLVASWINTIEGILLEEADDRFIDHNAGPLSELDRWRRRQRLLTSITEQLKSKECKAVISTLITAKSRLLKKWKIIDAGITDAMNETKDKVKYLESLRRYLIQLYQNASPSQIINTAIPGLITCVKQMDSISRFYNRTGFLGLLFTKVTNQLVIACKEYIKSDTSSRDGNDVLWEKVANEIKEREDATITDSQPRHFRNQVESRLKPGAPRSNKSKESRDDSLSDDSLFGKLKACLSLQSTYRDALRSLRDSLGTAPNLSHFPSFSSFGDKGLGGNVTNRSRPERAGSIQNRMTGGNLPSKKGSSAFGDILGHGVSMADEEAVMGHMDTFCNRIHQFIEVINTMSQYSRMMTTANGMARPREEDLIIDNSHDEKDGHLYKQRKCDFDFSDNDSSTPDRTDGRVLPQVTSELKNLGSISENEEKTTHRNSGGRESDQMGDEVFTVRGGLNAEELDILRQYYPSGEEEDGPSVCSVIAKNLQRMGQCMAQISTKTMLDVESKDKVLFDEYYMDFQAIVGDLEKFLAAYLHALFTRKMKTHEGLDVITRFSPIQNRSGIRVAISEKFVQLFSWYEKDLEEVQRIYEKYKDEPQTVRNAPPVAGAIHWSRQLLKKIEDPMKVFRDNKAVNHSVEFARLVRLYNRLATALVTFESLWFTQWKGQIEQAKSGMKATLLVRHPGTGEMTVNADDKVLELIHEAKWLGRLGIQLPESASSMIQLESRFKSYKAHLELCLQQYKAVSDSIPEALKPLFASHLRNVQQQLQPGLNTLFWSSMNIDAFLHQVHAATLKLTQLSQQVNTVLKTKVNDVIEKIRQFTLFDYEDAVSRSWPPHLFKKTMVDRVEERSRQLAEWVKTIETGLQDVACMLAVRKAWTTSTFIGLSMAKSSFISKRKKAKKSSHNLARVLKNLVKSKEEEKEKTLTELNPLSSALRKSRNSSPDPNKQKKLTFDTAETETTSLTNEEKIFAAFIEHYKSLVSDAIVLATGSSLLCLAETSGCTGELVRVTSALFRGTSDLSSGSVLSGAHSRVTSASSFDDRPSTSLSLTSNITWSAEDAASPALLQFELLVRFNIPKTTIDPTVEAVQSALISVAEAIQLGCRSISWLGQPEVFYQQVIEDETLQDLQDQISTVTNGLAPTLRKHLFHFSCYDFLWKDDLHGNFAEFIESDPGTVALQREVERMLGVEKKVLAIPEVLPVGPVCLHTNPIKDALHGFAMAWKTQFASVLHEDAKKKLDEVVSYRSNVQARLEMPVQTLDQLNSALHLLEELRDMENKIDSIYLPIESMYDRLREFELRLPRSEVEEVDQLRERWQQLMDLADQVRMILLKERRGAFGQELDKQVKTFVVEVIQFRNSFDGQGPAVPGIPPSEAVSRLYDFEHRYAQYDTKRKTLDSVSKVFGIVCKPFPELDRTGEELELLSQLYGLFQKFIRFDTQFRDTLWSEVNLDNSSREVEMHWDECLALPSKLKDWDAYNDLKTSLEEYLAVFPLLQSLAANEIRNRHWLQVMHVTGSSFQLEANVFKLSHLLDIGLIEHQAGITEICCGASRELELEIKMRLTEEEWTEQVLSFENFKKRGPMYLDKAFTQRLLEQLEDAQALLANMLTSRYIGPLRDEAASWAQKLKEVAEVLELWLEVQDLWQYLEAVFSNSTTAKELPQEAKRFAQIDKGWTKMMKRAFETRNVLQCCYGGEVPKGVMLRHIYEELEICFRSLVGYLNNKRKAFPRFYFVSDPILLAILSRPNDLDSVRPQLKSLFSGISDVKLEKVEGHGNSVYSSTDEMSRSGIRGSIDHHRERGGERPPSTITSLINTETPPKIDKRLTHVYGKKQVRDGQFSLSPIHQKWLKAVARTDEIIRNTNPSLLSHHVYLPSEVMIEERQLIEAVSVTSSEGEFITLDEKVTLSKAVEVWLEQLKNTVSRSLKAQVIGILQDIDNAIPIEEWPNKYSTQVCRAGMLYYWTRECEQGISDIRYDRRALQSTLRKYGVTMSKLCMVLAKGGWKAADDNNVMIQRIRLESMISQSLYLKDMLETMCNRKLREVTDFDWRRCIRMYNRQEEEKPEPKIYILDDGYSYGNEFYGAFGGVSLTPLTEKCFLSMSHTIQQSKGSALMGPTCSGKTETTRGLAFLLGKFLGLFQCSPSSHPGSLGKILQGLASDGCWGCLDDIQGLSREAFSVVLDFTQAILSALKAKLTSATLGDGQEVPVKVDTGIFLTINNSVSESYKSLPTDLRSLFRTVSLIKPDMGHVLRAKCAVFGFKAPHILGTRLNVLIDQVRDQLSPSVHHNFTMTVMTGVLVRACQKRKYVREEKTQEKTEKQDSSRSNSQASEANPGGMLSVRPTIQSQPSSVGLGTVVGMKMGPGKKNSGSQGLTPAGKVEHAIVAQAVEEIIGPRLDMESMVTFKSIVKDVFAGLPEPPAASRAMSGIARTVDIDQALEQKATDSGLVPHKAWLNKCLQLFTVSQVHNGTIVAGPPGSGKSTCIEVLVEALSLSPREKSSKSRVSRHSTVPLESNHKLQRINPVVVDDDSLMFGYINQNQDFVDGIFTTTFRKANRNQSTTWLCMDGPLNASWADNFNSLLDSERVLHLRNGDKIVMSDKVKLLFETDDLTTASPATVSRAGIVYVDKNVLGWKPIVKAWLNCRSAAENHPWNVDVFGTDGVLQRSFNKTMDPVSTYVLQESKLKLKMSEVGMLKTCLNLLSSMLADNIEIGGELHIERLYLFCLIWTFGGLLDKSDRKGFSDLLKTLSSALPDDDRDICVFDYYVDESGEWDPWHSRVPESPLQDSLNILGECVVDTVETIRTRVLMELATAADQNVMLAGPPGSGKTFLINDFLHVHDPQQYVIKRLVFSGSSSSKQLQQFIEANVYHRQGFVYGAKEKKKLQVFIDDLNLPRTDDSGVQSCNEFLRQLLDAKVMCTGERPFEWKTVEGLSVISGMSHSEHCSVENRNISARLLRHFAVFWLPAAEGEALKSVVYGVLEANMTQGDKPSLELELQNALVEVSCKLLTTVQSVLTPTPMPGRFHYLFSLRELVKCFQCLKRLPDESRADEVMVVSLWKHEIERIMRDRISRFADANWFDTTMSALISEAWPHLEKLHNHFVTFPTDARLYNRPVASVGKQVKVVLQPVESLKDVHACLSAHLNHYNEEFGNITLNILLSDFVISHIVRMHRVLSFHNGGNMLLIGSIGSHLSTLCRLALHVADVGIHHVDSSKQNTFFDGLRSAIRLSGSEGKILTMMFTARDLNDPVYLDAINSILISGEYPHLFSNDEMEGLLLALTPQLKREHPNMLTDPMKFFVSRVKMNLHILICLPPDHYLLDMASSHFPGLLSACQINWLCDWPQESLLGEASYYISKHLGTDQFLQFGENVMTCLANIHSFALRDCKQLTMAGDLSAEIPVNQVKVNEKKKDQLKLQSVMVPNLPYSKVILQENIKFRHKGLSQPSKNDTFVGPTTYARFMDCFKSLYTMKAEERTEKVERLKKVLATLDQTRNDVKVMKKAIKSITSKYEESKVETAQLLKQLTEKATKLEKLKAKVGLSSSLDAYLHLNELESDEDEEDELLKTDEYDDYDKEFDRLREANLKTRQVQAKEDLKITQKVVDDSRKTLEYAKEQVIYWKGRVDRQCIERLKAFSNPPTTVGQVMEMVMTLIGKRLPFHRSDKESTKDDVSSRMSTSSSGTKVSKKGKTKEPSERVDRSHWKAMQNSMNDVLKFVDMLHNVPWEDGLKDDVLHAVESYLGVGRDGKLGVTGEGTLLENAAEVHFPAHRRSPSPERGGITIASARYSSEDCATLVQYTIAIVEYTHRCGPLKAALEKLHELEREIEENERLQREKENTEREAKEQEENQPEEEEEEEDYTEADLPRVRDEVYAQQQLFDKAVVKKHSFEIELKSMNERLKAATEMVDSLKSQEKHWREFVKENEGNELLLANCMTAAAYFTYSGPGSTDTRKRMGEFFMQVCEHHGLPLHKKQLFRNIELFDFLYSKIEVMQLRLLDLPSTHLMLENSCFLMQENTMTAWPLICDPTSRVIDWLKKFNKDKGIVEVKYHEMRHQLESSLSDGCPLLVTDCDVQALSRDKRFRDTIQKTKMFVQSKTPFKVMVSDHEVEVDPKFRLFLHTTCEPYQVPHRLSAYASVLFFQQSRPCVEEELLDRFMKQEKSRLEDERTALRQEMVTNMEFLNKIEQQMLANLSNDLRLMNDLNATKKLADLKKQFDETEESQSRIESSEASILRARESYRVIARRGAVCFDTAQYMRDVNPLYQTAYTQFLALYDTAISHSERAAVKAVVDRLTLGSYLNTARTLLERDRFLYSLLLCLEVEDSIGHVMVGEREFIISPNYAAMVMSALGIAQGPDSKIALAKKPFDWMTDDQFHNLQILASHFEWFQDMFDRMPKDGREMQWRNLCENDSPEKQPLPDKMDEQYHPLQRMCVLRAVRSDRLMHASSLFVNSVLGKKYLGDVGIDLASLLRQSSPTTPILLLFSSGGELAQKLFTDFANRKQSKTIIYSLSDNSTAGERMARKYLQMAVSEGYWLLLHNAHNAPNLLNNLESILAEYPEADSQFRCWISSQAKPEALPVRLLQIVVKTVVDSPKPVKDNLIRSFTWMEPDILRQSNRPEWPAVLHNICYLHSAIRHRARFGRGGWNNPQDFSHVGSSELQAALNLCLLEFKEAIPCYSLENTTMTRSTSWTGLRYMLSEVIYGSCATDRYDQQTVSAMVDYWLSPNSIKKDFEVAKLKYKTPQAFFSPHARLNYLLQALDGLSSHLLETPEAGHLHSNAELKKKVVPPPKNNIPFSSARRFIFPIERSTPRSDEIKKYPKNETSLGEDQYIYTRLNVIYDNMPSSKSLSHKLFPRPPTPLSGPPIVGVSSNYYNPAGCEMGVFASSSYAALKMRKEVELWELCHNMLPKVPRAYNKEYIVDRVRKIGGFTAFNTFIIRELDTMYKLLQTIKNTLQAIKNATEERLLGDQCSPEVLSAADDLYHLKIPLAWCRMSGSSAPPVNCGLAQWLAELQSRCHHFEKILVLGREKMPAYWLGAFFNPRGLLALLKQEAMAHHASDRGANFEQFAFQTEITSRDKDHLRDPPQDGMFVYGIYFWGCAWEKTTGELLDLPPRQGCTPLPVVHITCWPISEKPYFQDTSRAAEYYACPVFPSRINQRTPILEMDVRREYIPASRWALRGLSATIRPY